MSCIFVAVPAFERNFSGCATLKFFWPCDKFCITWLLVTVKRLFSEIDHLSAHPSNLINAVRWLIDRSVGVAPSLRSNFVGLDFESQKDLLTSIAVLLIDQPWHCWSQMIACCVLNNSKTFFMEQNATFSIRDKCFVFYWIEPTWINSFASFYLFWGIVVASNGGSALELATLTVPWSRKSSGSTLVHNIKNLLKLQNHKITKYCYKVSPFKSVWSEFEVMWLWNHLFSY